MAVPEEMRKVERVIDSRIASLPVWTAQREVLLWMILNYYKESMGEVFMRFMHGRLFGNTDSTRIGLLKEHSLHSGILQALKWAMEFASSDGSGSKPELLDLAELVKLGALYEILVDSLKMGRYDRVAIHVDRDHQVVTVYEGGDLTGADNQLIEHQVDTLPYYSHSSFVDNEDALTSKWTAGDYREVVERLAGMARLMETSQGISTLPGSEAAIELPAIIEIPDYSDPPKQSVLEDLTLAPEKVAGRGKWLLTALLDVPLVMIGTVRVGVTNVLKTVGGGGRDDHMLRVASRVDPEQYSRVSGLRENRMIQYCTPALEKRGWIVTPHHKLRNPSAELDIYARRSNENLILQLKSTLRPETPWEVQKRNDDILDGIDHTAAALARLPPKSAGLVITDGYRGDYVTWATSNSRDVIVGTIRDIDEISESPEISKEVLKLRAGFKPREKPAAVPDREFRLFEWTFRLVDKPEP